jgi:formylglycine-generating enzyme required for sulfatase activity
MDATPFAGSWTRNVVLVLTLVGSAWAIRLALDDRLSPAPPGAIVLSPPDFTVTDRIGMIELAIIPPVIGRAGRPAPAAPVATPGGEVHADQLSADGVVLLGVLLEMKVGSGTWEPPHADGVAADGLVAVFHDRVLVRIRTIEPWVRHAFRARTLIGTAGAPPGGVVSGPRHAGGPAAAPPGSLLGQVLTGYAAHPEAAAQPTSERSERRYCSESSDETVMTPSADIRFVFITSVEDPAHSGQLGAQLEVNKLVRETRMDPKTGAATMAEKWLATPVEYKLLRKGDPLDFERAVPDPLVDGKGPIKKENLTFHTDFTLDIVQKDVKRIEYYEVKTKSRAAGGRDKDLEIHEKLIQTDAVELDSGTGQKLILVKLAKITRPPHPAAIIYPDFPTLIYDEVAEFRKDPAAFQQWGLIPTAPIEHDPGTGPLEEQRKKTGNNRLATDTTYYEVADGRLVYWEPVGKTLQVYRIPGSESVGREAPPVDDRPQPISHAVVPEAERPFWAAAAGSDDTGRWADLVLRDVRQRLRWIPPGSFTMGSPHSEAGRDAGEVPHRVDLSSGFWLMDSPCTQALWQEVMAANPSRFADDPQGPVEGVSFADVQAFIAALNQRVHGEAFSLPSEAQFEYASRAGHDEPFGGAALDAIGWYAGNSGGRTHPVRAKQANRWGLYDLHGNVWEWCGDWRANYPAEPVTDPHGLDWGLSQRVIRGGSWMSSAERCRAGCRDGLDPIDHHASTLGFRLSSPAFAPGYQPLRARVLPTVADLSAPVPGTHPRGAGWTVATGDDRYGHWADLELKGVRQRLRWIRSGWFIMGSPKDEEGRTTDERQHAVQISKGFWMADSACTQELWQAVMGSNPAHFTGDAQRPVESVSWWQVSGFLAAVQSVVNEGRVSLPSEAQREYACRAGTVGPFAGSALEAGAWFASNSGGATHAVKQRAPNAWGLYDLQGGVWEWCYDWHGPYPAPGGADEVSDPIGPEDGECKVVRGGSWALSARFCRAARRDYLEPGGSTAQVGFRFCIEDYWH